MFRPRPSTGAVLSGQPRSRRALFAVLLCNALEWFDFAIYGLLALHIARVFFPEEAGNASLLATLAVFGVSFVMRPLGALVLGGLGDRRGRKPALLLAAGLMAAATLAIGLIPSYERIGVAAPLALLAARLVQGFSAGGEWGVANAFLLETAQEGRRGFAASFLSVTVAIGSALASGSAALLGATLSDAAMAEWGWRLPFLFGALLGLIALWLRVSLDETPAYRRMGEAPAAVEPSRPVRWPGFLVVGFAMHWTVCYYIFIIYMPLFTQKQAGLSPAQAGLSTTLSTLVIIVLVPLIGALSDRYGRRPFLMLSCLCALLLTVPAFWAVERFPTLALIIGVQAMFAMVIALYSGPAPAVTAELFATRERSRGSSFAYAITTALFGGFAPFIAVWLTGVLDSPLAPTLYVLAASAISLAVVWHLPETARRPLS